MQYVVVQLQYIYIIHSRLTVN